MRPLQGYTLLEIFITVALTSILLLAIIPDWHYFQTRMQSEAVIRRLTTTLHFARNAAISTHTSIRICPSDDGHHCDNNWNYGWIVYLPSQNNSPTLSGVLKAYPGIEIGLLSWHSLSTHSYIQFNSQGNAQGYNGSFTYSISKDKQSLIKIIILSPTGRVRED